MKRRKQPAPDNRADGRAPLRGDALWTYGLVGLAFCQLLLLWMTAYGRGSPDNRAVHHYSAARLYAGNAAVCELRMAEPVWMHRLNPEQRSRLRMRLHGYANSAIPDSLLRLLCASSPAKAPRADHEPPVKKAFTLLFLLALGWLIAVTLGYPMDAILLAACLLLAAFGFSLQALAPASDPSVSFLIEDPRGTASLLILAAFACFARGRGVLAGISLLLATGWNAGLAVITVPCALLSFGLTLCDRYGSRYIRILLALLVALGTLFLIRFYPGSFVQTQVWIPAGFVILFLLAGAEISHPALRASSSLAAFLFLTLIVILTIQRPSVLTWLVKVTGNRLIDELPLRLTAVRHLAALALSLAALFGMMDHFLSKLLAEGVRNRMMLTLASLGLAWAFVAGHDSWLNTRQTVAAFRQAGEGTPPRTAPSSRDLPTLDPRHESSFFFALGDYLLTAPHRDAN